MNNAIKATAWDVGINYDKETKLHTCHIERSIK